MYKLVCSELLSNSLITFNAKYRWQLFAFFIVKAFNEGIELQLPYAHGLASVLQPQRNGAKALMATTI